MNLPGHHQVTRALRRVDRTVGGAARRRVITVFAAVLALNTADQATVGASAMQLESGLHIDRTAIGTLLAVSSLVGAAATIPAGVLVDRTNRTRLLSIAIVFWGVATALSGLATDYRFLLWSRTTLGVVTAVAGPAVASLLGDYFPEGERGKVYGYVLTGELIGSGFGFIVSGNLAAFSWRAAFLVLVAPTALVWWLVWRLPEPERGGASRLRGERPGRDGHERDPLHDAVAGQDVDERVVLREDPDRMSLPQAVRYVLRIRSNVVLIAASALGYFFFAGVRAFGVEFTKTQYGVSQSLASSGIVVLGVGALAGVLVGGRLADKLLRRGRATARFDVPGWAVVASGIAFVPAIVTKQLWIALPLLVVAAFCLGAANPPLDAARLDVVHPKLWGRAEAVRTVLRNLADAVAPVLFGLLTTAVFTGSSALEYALLVMLVALFAAAATLLRGRRHYPADAAAAARSPAIAHQA